MLKYVNYNVVFQEVPDEISLAINISNCPHRCKNCHSQYLWDDIGNVLINDLDNLISMYKPYITCVCFMGGDQDIYDLEDCLRIVKNGGLKTCVYSGRNSTVLFEKNLDLYDYIKVGKYIEDLGGLSSPKTNQRFYKVENGNLTDKTNIFWKD